MLPPLVLLGRGPLPGREHRHHAAAGLRAWQFATALAAVNAETELLLIDSDATPGSSELDGVRITTLPAATVDDAAAFRRLLDERAPAALVGATAYASFLLARSGHPAPLWVDLHGDPAAEGQALALAREDDHCLADYLWMLHWCLRRGDRFSVVSTRQRLVALGQLGAVGRLGRHTATLEWVAVLPDAVSVPPAAIDHPPSAGFQVVISGSFNSWIDGETLLAGMSEALTASTTIRFAVTGGAVAGYLEAPWERFCAQLEHLPEASRRRIQLHGWVPQSELESIERSSACGLVSERALLEREIGSQNRSLRWMARGLPVVTTTQSELGEAIAAERLGLAYRPGDASDLARALLELASRPDHAHRLGRRARDWVLRNRSVAATTGALTAWARRPEPAPDRIAADSVALGERLLEPLAAHPALPWVREARHRAFD